MSALIECVPNFSEGRDSAKIDTIINAIRAVSGVTLLDVDPGKDTNRTVVTFVGSPEAVAEGAFQGIAKAASLIDMSKHSGAHPRMGATDVCPFIPVRDATIEDCVAISRKVGKRVGEELGIPIFLYEYSASKPENRNLAYIREGEYEAMEEKLKRDDFVPDFGPSIFNPRPGVTAIGCRDFLIAYNINLNTRDARLATDIAFELREKGRSKRKPHSASDNLLDGEILRYAKNAFPCSFCEETLPTVDELANHTRDSHQENLDEFLAGYGYSREKLIGKAVKQPGLFKNVKAIGWYMDTYNRAQISINFIKFRESTIHDVFDAACRLAEERGVRVTGSELVGLIPLEAIQMAGEHYLEKQGRTTGIPMNDVIETAVQSLGLNDVAPFVSEEKIIDLAVTQSGNRLVDLTASEFALECSRNSPAPGGGSVSALAGELGAGLASMVAALTFEKKGFFGVRSEMEKIGVQAQKLLATLNELVDADTEAFNRVMDANRLPAVTDEEKAEKAESVLEANKEAIRVPFRTMEAAHEIMRLAAILVEKGNPNSVSDAGVAAEMALAAVHGAGMNVLINLSGVAGDETFASAMKLAVDKHYKSAENEADKIRSETLKRIAQ